MRMSNANECVTPVEKDPPTYPKVLQAPGFVTVFVSCGILFLVYSNGVKKKQNASLHSVTPFSETMHTEENSKP